MSTTFQQATAQDSFDEDDIEAFAELSGDFNALHLDEEYAAKTRFGEPIVHGALVTSLISAALAELEGTVIYLDQEVEFIKPVYPGEELLAVATLQGESNGVSTFDVTVEKGDGVIVVDGEASVVIE